MNETRIINWTAGTGNEIEITMVAQYGLNSQGIRKTSGPIEISTDTKIDGRSMGGMAKLETVDHPKMKAKISNGTKAVGMIEENYNRYLAARQELEAIAKPINDACDANADAVNAIIDGRKEIEATA